MNLTDFKGQARPLDALDIPQLSARLKTGEDELRAFLEVEARSRGFDREGRPIMLFEPHVFYRNITDGAARDKAVKAGLAYAKWTPGKYPADSYPRLKEAMAIDRVAALKACSIGSSQVLVENYSSLGYTTPEAMWLAFMEDEQEHVDAMVRFILVNGIDDDLRAHRWETVARVYNGPSHVANDYAGKMARAFAKFKGQADTNWSPAREEEIPKLDEDALRAVQKRMLDLGYVEVGMPDGHWGTKTRAGTLAFRADNDLPIWAGIDDQFMSTLMTAKHREISEERATMTAQELKDKGSTTIAAADQTATAGTVTAGAGGILIIGELLKQVEDSIEPVKAFMAAIEPLTDKIYALGPLGMVALGAFIIWKQRAVIFARVEAHRTGNSASPKNP